MRRTFVVLALAAALAMVLVPASGRDVGQQFGCSATSGAAVSLVGVEGPSCSFDLICFSFCVYSVRISANGTGLVEAAMTATVQTASEPGTTAQFADTDSPTDPPSCSGILTCSAPADDTTIGLVVLGGGNGTGFALITIRCSAGGLAAVQSVGCQANNLQFEELPL